MKDVSMAWRQRKIKRLMPQSEVGGPGPGGDSEREWTFGFGSVRHPLLVCLPPLTKLMVAACSQSQVRVLSLGSSLFYSLSV